MKMAKAPKEEWEKVMKFANELDQKINEVSFGTEGDAILGKWVRDNAVWMGRVVFGYSVLVDNCCDPNSNTLEWKPELAALMEPQKTP